MIKIAVCDDEEYFRNLIVTFLEDYMKNKSEPYIIDTFHSGKQLVSLGMDVAQYTIVFMDINMDEINGIEAAKEIRKYDTSTILVFITAFMDYTLEGYKVEAFRYILKRESHMKEPINECMNSIFYKMAMLNKKMRFNFVEGEQEVSLNKIIYIESRLHKLEIHMLEQKENTYTLYEKLDDIEKLLEKHKFLRIHQSFLVNMRFINQVKKYKVLMDNKEEIPIPRARYKVVNEKFISYKGEL